jgi:maltose/moltooligosaccharide transporter
VILAGSIPPERTGVYMGIFNMMIVLPMLLFALTLPLIYGGEPVKVFGLFSLPTVVDVLHGDPRNVLTLSGVMLLAASASVLWVREGRAPV